jgi:hypothetical protein
VSQRVASNTVTPLPHSLGCTLPLSGSGRKRGGGSDWDRRCLLSSTSSSPSPSPAAAVAAFGADEAHLQGRLHTAEAGVAGSCGAASSRRCDRKLLLQEPVGEVLDEVVLGCAADLLCVPLQPPLDVAAGGSGMAPWIRAQRTQEFFSSTTTRCLPLPLPTQLDEAPVVMLTSRRTEGGPNSTSWTATATRPLRRTQRRVGSKSLWSRLHETRRSSTASSSRSSSFDTF